MSPLHHRLAALRRRLFVTMGTRGICATLATFLAGLLLAGLLDFVIFRTFGVESWSLMRAAMLVAVLGSTGVVFYRLLVKPWTRRTDDLSLALQVEEQYPILNDALASTVQFLDAAGPESTGTSASLKKEAVQRALRLAQGCDFNKAIQARGLAWLVFALVAILAVVLPLVMLRPALARTALARIADPFGEHPWIGTQTELSVGFPRFLAVGQPLIITGELHGVVPAKAEIEFDDASLARRHADIKEIRDGHGSFIATGIQAPSGSREIRFRVRAGDAISPKQAGTWHVVVLRQPPQLVSLHGKPSPQFVVRQPRYTELPEFLTIPPGTLYLDVVAGSHVTLRAAADRPLANAWIEFKPVLPAAKESLLLAGFGPRHPLDGVATNAVAHSVWGRAAAALSQSGKEFDIHFTPALTGAFILTLQDADGLLNSYAYELNVRSDPVPVVSLLRPSVSQSVLADAEITLQLHADDRVFGLRNVYLEYRRKDKHGQWIDGEPKRVVFFDSAKAEVGLPRIFSVFAAAPFRLPFPPLHLRPHQLLITQRWSLRGLAVEGETLVIQACGEDFNDVIPFPQVGRSHEIELKIVAKTALAGVLEEHEVRIQQQLLKLRDMQEKAINKVIGAEEEWKATGKLRPETAVDLAEAEQLQKDIQARVGEKKDEGLRGELAQLEEMMKDNKMPKSELADRVQSLRQELDRISRENLPKIEPSLTKARRELESPEQPKLPDPKNIGDLGEARLEQEKVQKALDEMLKFMEERSTLQQLKGELRAILQEQKERESEVGKLQDAMTKQGEQILQEDSQLKAELRRTAELQRRLADRADRLIEQLNELSQKMEQKDPNTAENLARAAKMGGPIDEGGEAVATAMREIADRLRDDFDLRTPPPKSKAPPKSPNVDFAHKAQIDQIVVLEKMLEALDQVRADEVERLVVRQKIEEKGLKDLAAKMDKLQKDIETAKKIGDAQQREAALKKLGEELRELQTQAEQSARQLARAQAKDAAEDLRDAAKKMERILRQLERGEEPDEALKQAQDRIDEARSKLKDAREIAEEELSREQIAKIVDRLKGLKERQDSVLVETERLRKDFLQHNNWTYPKILSLGELKATQKGIAGETAIFKDKLKGAKVFHMLLDRSVNDMLKATDKAEDWQIKANQHWKIKALQDKAYAEEKTLYESTVKLQKSAGDRLQRLIDALLPELEEPKVDPKPPEPAGGGGGGGAGEPEKKGGIQAQDGIPSVAQLKALKAEQLEVNARTKEFADQHPNVDQLSPAERTELELIHAEQERLLQLFRELVTAAGV